MTKKVYSDDERRQMFLVVALVNMGWSLSQVGKQIGRSKQTVSNLYARGCDELEEGNLDDLHVLRGSNNHTAPKMDYVGGSNELEIIEQTNMDRERGDLRPKYHCSDDNEDY